MKKFIIFAICLALLSGCSWLSPFAGNTKSAQRDYSKMTSDESYQAPAFVNGRTVVLNNRIKKTEVNRTNKEIPLNVWQKFCRWLGNLSVLIVLVVVGGLFAGTTAPLMFLWSRYQTFRKALTQTVSAIEKSKAVDKDPELKNALSSGHDASTKTLISSIKHGTGG